MVCTFNYRNQFKTLNQSEKKLIMKMFQDSKIVSADQSLLTEA